MAKNGIKLVFYFIESWVFKIVISASRCEINEFDKKFTYDVQKKVNKKKINTKR